MDITMNYYSSILIFGVILFGSVIFKLLGRLWWNPMKIQRLMRAQGVQGPSYNFIHGNTKEMYSKRIKAMAKPMQLSHRILPRVLPHILSWLNQYGIYIYITQLVWIMI